MTLKLIVAVAKNQTIGVENKLPWHLPEDLAWFKKNTSGHPIIMGRNTWDSIGRPLPNRLNIVLTKNTQWLPHDQTGEPLPFSKLDKTIESASSGIAVANNLHKIINSFTATKTLFLIGGARLYHSALEQDLIDELIITEINAHFKGDAFFPNWDKSRFDEISREHHPQTNERQFSYDFVRYTRKKQEL